MSFGFFSVCVFFYIVSLQMAIYFMNGSQNYVLFVFFVAVVVHFFSVSSSFLSADSFDFSLVCAIPRTRHRRCCHCRTAIFSFIRRMLTLVYAFELLQSHIRGFRCITTKRFSIHSASLWISRQNRERTAQLLSMCEWRNERDRGE